jgi:transcriptional regulator with XRE-family HTH domain
MAVQKSAKTGSKSLISKRIVRAPEAKREHGVLGAYFRDKRISRGVTQTELATVLGFGNGQYVSNWERGMCSPPLESIYVMIDLLNLPKDEVMNLIIDDNRRFLKSYFASKPKGSKSKKHGT